MGFELVGIAPATSADGFDRMGEWLDRGYAGEMSYMERRREARRHPSSILPEVRSIVMAGMNYNQKRSPPSKPTGFGPWVATYALGTDYHTLLRSRLKSLLSYIQTDHPSCRGRAVVDTAPLLERDFARRAGLGWFGKNTMLIDKRHGSFFLLGALLLDLDLAPDPPHAANHCGTCTACLDACPTQAFVEPGLMDARRCISYLTIELRSSIPEELREPMGAWLFGCDVCQDVCPWNRKAPLGREPLLQPRRDLAALDPIELLGLSDEAFRRRFRDTALMRPGRAGLLRNAAIVLGNQRNSQALPALHAALADPEPLVREAAEWAIQRISTASG